MVNQTEDFRNRFKMKKELGKGANGVVYLAFDNYLQKDVALKLTHLSQFEDDENGTRNRRMWLNETRLAGKLQHPFIVHIIESGNSDEFDYLVMEYVEGVTLKQHSSADSGLDEASFRTCWFSVHFAVGRYYQLPDARTWPPDACV